MKYAISDLHGCYEKYMKMLEKINFSDDDELYVLGDVCDRGDGGIKILLDMMKRPNVTPLKGNHDYMAQKLLPELENEYESEEQNKTLEIFRLWLLDGANPTIKAFLELDEQTKAKVLAYIRTFQYYEKVSAGGREFFLSHTLPDYEDGNTIYDYPILMFSVGEADYEKDYIPGTYTVTGHTPTMLIDPDFKGRILKKGSHIAIDCGAVFGNPLGCICLDTMEEFYVD